MPFTYSDICPVLLLDHVVKEHGLIILNMQKLTLFSQVTKWMKEFVCRSSTIYKNHWELNDGESVFIIWLSEFCIAIKCHIVGIISFVILINNILYN